MTITVCILKISTEYNFLEETVKSLEENREFIDNIIYTGYKEDFEKINTDLQVQCLNINSENKAFLRNKILENVDGNYLLWLKDGSILEEETLEEYIEIIDEFPDTNIIYPNEIIIDLNNEENIRNLKDWHGKEIELLQGLTLERYIPEFGVLTKKEIFDKYGFFDEEFEDYEFYRFLSFNIKNLSLKLSELSFITNKITNTFIDTSFHSKNLRDIINLYDWKTEIFPELNWENENIAKATAYSIVADRLKNYLDFYNASEFYKRALLTFHNQHSLKELIDIYIKMGFFKKARYILYEQGLGEDEIQNYEERINDLENLIKSLEEAVKEGKVKEVFTTIPDVISIYEGAPIYNILGVIHYIGKDIEGAFRYFYKATTMNPVNQDYQANLIETAKMLNKEEKVQKLIKRLLSS